MGLKEYQCYLVCLTLICYGWQLVSAASSVLDAFDDDINSCLFAKKPWSTASVVSGNVDCDSYGSNYKPLCYGLSKAQPALFIVCYDTKKLIPAFTAHVVEPVTGSASSRPKFKKDSGKFKPTSQAECNDYSANQQDVDFSDFDFRKNFYCAKGHLVPNADYGTDAAKAAATFILTNAAPQWQRFNGGNWLIMETAVRNYANDENREVYVFTGTGGEATFTTKASKKAPYLIGGRVTAPKYYWMLICDVKIKKMVIFVGENPVGVTDETSTKKGCKNADHKEMLGVMYCYSYNEVKGNSDYSDFKLPSMDTTNCPTSTKGTFIDPKFS